MTLVRFVLRTCRWMMVLTAVAALASGACNAGLIAIVNSALTDPTSPTALIVIGFIALGIGKLVTSLASQLMLTRFAQRAAANLRQDLVRRILAVPLRALEEVGPHRVMVALTDDVYNISQALLAIPLIGVNLAILIGGAAYLGFLSYQVLLLMCAFIVVGALSYHFFIKSGFRYLQAAREVEDKLFGHFRGLTEGIKELKLHRPRRGVFINQHVHDTTQTYMDYNVSAENRFTFAQHWSNFLFFALIGVLLFAIPKVQPVDKATLMSYVITTLYLMGPLAGVLGSFSLFSRANVALDKIQTLGVSLAAQPAEECTIESPMPHTSSPTSSHSQPSTLNSQLSSPPSSPTSSHSQPSTLNSQLSFRSLQLRGITHAYHREAEGHNFTLGPIDIAFASGEVVFLAGGNGSGKSTLAKIIAGLYPPESGEIRLDGIRIDDRNRDDYRQLFTAIFSDFYLFESLLGLEQTDLQAQKYLRLLQLNHKVSIQDGRLSTTALSQGQRKRLALLTAYLEDRPFYVFDEWAADQDPYFREIFYTQLLPELKARGKTVLVITHDDKYFHLADRFLKLDMGNLITDTELQPDIPALRA